MPSSQGPDHMTEFDALKAVREELAALSDVLRVMKLREQAAEAAMGQAEVELNAVRKLRGFCQLQIEQAQARRAELDK
jgi:hypothetical protein